MSQREIGMFFCFSSRRRHTSCGRDWSSDVCSSDLAARRAVSLEPGNWRHLFRLGHATWGEERLRAGAATLALYPDFAFAYFQSAMVHVARGHLTEAEGVLRHGAAIQ